MGRQITELTEVPDVRSLLVKGLVGSVRKRGVETSTLPDRAYLLDDQPQDVTRLAAYAHLTGFPLSDVVPSTWLHVNTFPLQAALLASDEFPFSLAGLVHVTNTMTLHRPVAVTERLRLCVSAQNLTAHAKGATFDMVSRIKVGDELVWEGTSNYLASGVKVPGELGKALRLAAPEVEPSQQWRLAPDLGRRYAAVSGDSNPIHLHPVTARAFGFPRPIIHGMWTHARALAGLGHLPDAYSVKVQFAKPILLPGKVSFAAERTDAGWGFAVVNKEGKPHLVGELS